MCVCCHVGNRLIVLACIHEIGTSLYLRIVADWPMAIGSAMFILHKVPPKKFSWNQPKNVARVASALALTVELPTSITSNPECACISRALWWRIREPVLVGRSGIKVQGLFLLPVRPCLLHIEQIFICIAQQSRDPPRILTGISHTGLDSSHEMIILAWHNGEAR